MAGAETVLIEDEPESGRRGCSGARSGKAYMERVKALARQVQALPACRYHSDATCTGLFADNWFAVVRGNRLRLRASAVVLATGASSSPGFRNNDLPGVMLARPRSGHVGCGGAPRRPSRRGDGERDGYAAALDLLDAGIDLAAVWDLRPRPRLVGEYCSAELTAGACGSGMDGR